MSKEDQTNSQTKIDKLNDNVATDTQNLSKGILNEEGHSQNLADQDYANTQAQNAVANNTLSQATGAANKMATTGGFSDADKSNYLKQATSGVKNSYNILGQQAKLNQIRTGAASGPAAIAQIARQGGQQQAQTTTGALSDVNQQINANKNAGINELTGAGNAQTNISNVDKSLFDTNTGQVTAQGAQLLQAYGLKYQTQAEAQSLLAQIANNTKGPLDNALGIANTAANLGKAFKPTSK